MEVHVGCIVEGHGDREAVPVLIRRIAERLDPALVVHVASPIRTSRYKLEALRKSLAQGLLFLRSPFDKLRANGSGVEIVKDFPFVLSPSTSSGQALSKHGFVSFGSFDGFRRAS